MNSHEEQQNIIIVGSYEDGEILLSYELQLGQTLWAVTQETKSGDRVWFYITKPVSAIVATGIVSGEVTYQEHDMQLWSKHFVATIKELEIIRPTPIDVLKKAFPDWRKLEKEFCENFILPAHWVNFFREVLEVGNASCD